MCFQVVIMLIFNVFICAFIDLKGQKYHIIIPVLFVPGYIKSLQIYHKAIVRTSLKEQRAKAL